MSQINDFLMYTNIFLLAVQTIGAIKMVVDRNNLSREIENFHSSISTFKVKNAKKQ